MKHRITWHYAPRYSLLEVYFPDGSIATIQGEDANTLDDRLDNASEAGKQDILQDYASVATMPDEEDTEK